MGPSAHPAVREGWQGCPVRCPCAGVSAWGWGRTPGSQVQTPAQVWGLATTDARKDCESENVSLGPSVGSCVALSSSLRCFSPSNGANDLPKDLWRQGLSPQQEDICVMTSPGRWSPETQESHGQ